MLLDAENANQSNLLLNFFLSLISTHLLGVLTLLDEYWEKQQVHENFISSFFKVVC